MCAPIGRRMSNISPEQPDHPGIRPQIAADLIEQRGLAGAVRSDDQPALARPHFQGHILRDDQAAKGLLEVHDFKCVLRAHRASPRSAAISLVNPGTMPAGITRTMKRNTSPSSMFQRST